MYKVYRGKKSNIKFFENDFEAENYAYELSEKYPKANVYLDKDYYSSFITVAKYHGGIQVGGCLIDMF